MTIALGDYVLLKTYQPSEGGIILDTKYEVLSIGDTVPIRLKIGDKVIFDMNKIIDSSLKDLIVVNYNDILAVE